MVQTSGQFRRDDSSPQLVLSIKNSRPITASDLGRVFASMSLDYRKQTGRDLVVARLEGGSVVAFLQEAAPYLKSAADFADSANHLFDFAKNIAAITVMTLGAGILTKKLFGAGGKNGSRTVESLAKMAVSAGANVEFFESGSPTPILRITPAEGRRVRRVANQNKKLKRAKVENENNLKIDMGMRAAIVDAVRRGDTETMSLLAAFAKMLKQHSLEHLLLELADELELEGYSDAAKFLRAAHRSRNPGGKTPLLGS